MLFLIGRFMAIGATVALLAGCGRSAVPQIGAPAVRSSSKPAAAHNLSVLHFFTGAPDGNRPSIGRLVFDKAGNLYGATITGGSGKCRFRNVRVGCGTIFELSPRERGGWMERVIYSFKGKADGAAPYSTLTFGSNGSIYGVTMAGGNDGCLPLWIYRGCGTAFELILRGATWGKRLLHVFTGGSDGGVPSSGLTLDAGRLYGTAHCGGGQYSCFSSGSGAGVLFVMQRSGGHWRESVIHAFGMRRGDAAYPEGDLTFINGNTFFGTTAASVYRISRSSPSAPWSETTLYDFPEANHSKGWGPQGPLALDAAGNIYGTTSSGGSYSKCSQGCGVIFELSRSSSGSWSETVLHAFSGGSDGATPAVGLTMDGGGTVFGTTLNGGDLQCNNGGGCGVVFGLLPRGSGSAEHVIHTFEDDASDGAFPQSAALLDSSGRIYGSTEFGGRGPSSGDGIVFKIAP